MRAARKRRCGSICASLLRLLSGVDDRGDDAVGRGFGLAEAGTHKKVPRCVVRPQIPEGNSPGIKIIGSLSFGGSKPSNLKWG